VTRFLLRLVLIAAGLVFAASLAVVFGLLFALWCVRAAWAMLTGRPVMPFIVRVDPRGGFERMYRRAEQGSRTPRADAVRPVRPTSDVTDVEPRPPGERDHFR
jgi:fatty acid desaturase